MKNSEKIVRNIIKGNVKEAKKALYSVYESEDEWKSEYNSIDPEDHKKLADYWDRRAKDYSRRGMYKKAIVASSKADEHSKQIEESIEVSRKVKVEVYGTASDLSSLYDLLEDKGIELQGKEGGSYAYVEVDPQDVEETIDTIKRVANNNDIVVEAKCKKKKIGEDSEDFMTIQDAKKAFWQGTKHLRKDMEKSGVLHDEIIDFLNMLVKDGHLQTYSDSDVDYIAKGSRGGK